LIENFLQDRGWGENDYKENTEVKRGMPTQPGFCCTENPLDLDEVDSKLEELKTRVEELESTATDSADAAER
jgi:hypothetical protein